jgi:predicted secreted protein
MSATLNKRLLVGACVAVLCAIAAQASGRSPIGAVFATAIYFIVWWVTLFAVLPFGVRTQHDDGEVVQGTSAGAPVDVRISRIVALTTIAASILFLLALVAMAYRLIPLEPV